MFWYNQISVTFLRGPSRSFHGLLLSMGCCSLLSSNGFDARAWAAVKQLLWDVTVGRSMDVTSRSFHGCGM